MAKMAMCVLNEVFEEYKKMYSKQTQSSSVSSEASTGSGSIDTSIVRKMVGGQKKNFNQ